MVPYTGNPTATQSPSPPPTPEADPIGNMPQDTDPPNAATFAQALKVPLDFIAWLMKQRATEGQWAENIRRYFDANLRARFAIDHWGLPRGEFTQWKETWTPAAQFGLVGPVSGAAATNVGRWVFAFKGGASQTQSERPGQQLGGPPYPAGVFGTFVPNAWRSLGLQIDGGAAGNFASVQLQQDYVSTVFDLDTLVLMEAEITPKTVLEVEWRCGLNNVGESIDSIADGAYFARPDVGGTNWKCRTVLGGVQTEVDSGVAAASGAQRHFEIALVGANVADDSASHALFFIDGVLKANITSNLPINGLLATSRTPLPMFGGFRTAGATITNPVLMAGNVSYTHINRISTP